MRKPRSQSLCSQDSCGDDESDDPEWPAMKPKTV
jgi:hypothetical protein